MDTRRIGPTGRMSRRQDLGRVTLTVLFIGGLMVGSFWVLQPFLPAILWATTIVLATWPLMLWVQRHTGNRRGVAVLVMTMAILLVLIIPIWLAVSTVVTNIDVLADLLRTIRSMRVPSLPGWLVEIPWLGERAANAWGRLTSAGMQGLGPK